jgi:hypothetical protein
LRFFFTSPKYLHKRKRIKNSNVFKLASGLLKLFYRLKYQKEIKELKLEILSFKKTFNEEDNRFILYCCRVVLNSDLGYNEKGVGIKLPCREEIRNVLHINKNNMPNLINKMTEKGLIINTGSGKGGCSQEIYLKLDKIRAKKLKLISKLSKVI